MKTRLLSSLAALAALVFLIPIASNAQTTPGSTVTAATVTTLLSQNFSGTTMPPTGWTSTTTASGIQDAYGVGTYWYHSSGGNGGVGGTYGSAVAWTGGAWNSDYYGNNYDGYYCGPLTLTAPSVTTSSFPAADTQFVDFDLWYPDGAYMPSYAQMATTVKVFANGSTQELGLSGGGGSQGNCTFVVGTNNIPEGEDPSSYSLSSYWQHYHVALPTGLSSQTVTFQVAHGGSPTYSYWYTDNVAFTNVVISDNHYSFLTVNGPTTFNFGTVPLGQGAGPYYSDISSPAKNGGTINIGNYSITGANPGDFTLTRSPSSLAVGAKDSIGILYTPQGTGNRSATLTYQLLGGVPGTVTVLLSGSGVAPTVSYNTNALFRQVYTELTDTSAVQYLYVTAVGTVPLSVSNVYFSGLNSNSYIVTHLPAPLIPGGGTDSIGVRFTPTIEGRPDARMVIVSNASNNPMDTVSMNGIGILPRLVINNTYINNTQQNNSNTVNMSFGAVNVGADSCMYVTLVNPGSDTLAIEQNFFSSADYDFTMTPLTGADTLLLPGGGSQQIQVCFMPLKQGDRTATIRIKTNIPHTITTPTRDTSAFYVNITGTGVPFGHLAISGPATVPVSPVGTKLCWDDTLWNTGLAAVQVNSGAISGGDSSEFTYSGLTFPLTLQPSTFQTFDVCGNPTADSTQTAQFTATGTTGAEGGTPDTIAASIPLLIFGTTVCDSLHWVTNFPASTCFGTTDTAVISVTNCGNVATPYSASVSGADAAMFTVLNPATSSSESGGGVATFKVTYTPDTVQTDVTSTAVFNIAGGANGTLPLSATRGAAIIAGTGTAPLTPVGSSPASFTVIVKNTGDCDWNPGTPAVSSPYAYVSGAATIPPNGTDTLVFTFAPTSGGTFTQQVQFQNPVGVSVPWANVTVSGTAGTASVPMVSAQNGYSIDQSYPNPNNGTSNVEITLPAAGNVHLAILDITGNVVQNVLDQQEGAGSFTVTIKANDLASGTYFYQMTSGGVTLTRQMTIVK